MYDINGGDVQTDVFVWYEAYQTKNIDIKLWSSHSFERHLALYKYTLHVFGEQQSGLKFS